MEPDKETLETLQARLDVLCKGIVSEQNSVNYYKTLIKKTPEDSDANIGMRRMYYGLMLEEKNTWNVFENLLMNGNKDSKSSKVLHYILNIILPSYHIAKLI